MMKSMRLFLICCYAAIVGLTRAFEFCGQEDLCRIPLNDISCEDLVQNYVFQGTCCSLETIPATGGCRMLSSGQCAWQPRCEVCEGSVASKSRCNTEFRSGSSAACPVSEFMPLMDPTNPPTANGVTTMPTSAPTGCPEVTEAPTKAPTSASGMVRASLVGAVVTVLVSALNFGPQL